MALFGGSKKTSTKIKGKTLQKVDKLDISRRGQYKVPENVSEISDYAFFEDDDCKKGVRGLRVVECHDAMTAAPYLKGHKEVVAIKFPNNIKELNSNCEGCESLEKVVLPEKLEILGADTFSGCKSLSECSLPDGLKEIGSRAFAGCKSIEAVIIPSSVEKLGDGAYNGCRNLRAVVFEGKMPECDVTLESGEDPFFNCESLESVTYRGIIVPLPKNYLTAYQCAEWGNNRSLSIREKHLRAGQVVQVAPFVDYAVKNKKALPKLSTIIRDTNPEEVKDFYAGADVFASLAGEYISKWSNEIEKSSRTNEDLLSAYHKACIALGVFAEDDYEKAHGIEFMKNNIHAADPEALFREFSYFDTFKVGYSADFARSYMSTFLTRDKQKFKHINSLCGYSRPSWEMYESALKLKEWARNQSQPEA